MGLIIGIFGGAILTVVILGLYCSLVLSAENEKYRPKNNKKRSKKNDGK